MHQLMEVVRAENLKAVPLCGYAASRLGEYRQYQDLMSG